MSRRVSGVAVGSYLPLFITEHSPEALKDQTLATSRGCFLVFKARGFLGFRLRPVEETMLSPALSRSAFERCLALKKKKRLKKETCPLFLAFSYRDAAHDSGLVSYTQCFRAAQWQLLLPLRPPAPHRSAQGLLSRTPRGGGLRSRTAVDRGGPRVRVCVTDLGLAWVMGESQAAELLDKEMTDKW